MPRNPTLVTSRAAGSALVGTPRGSSTGPRRSAASSRTAFSRSTFRPDRFQQVHVSLGAG